MKIITLAPLYNEANCYILASDAFCAVIDPGYNAERIYKKACDEGLKISKILLTHAHFDHICAVNELAALVSCPVYIHKGDLAALYDISKNLSLLGTGSPYTVNSDIEVISLEDKGTVQIGGEALTVMSTPGHTPGSCLYIGDDFIITGDTLFARSIGRVDFPGGSEQQMKASLSKIKCLQKDYVLYSGHGPSTTLASEKLHNYYLQ